MILLIDAAGDRERAVSSLVSRGVHPTEIVERHRLKLGGLATTLHRMSKTHPEACYIFCRQIQAQFNRFPLKVAAVLSGAKVFYFCDEQKIGPGLKPTQVIFRDFPLYLWHCFYAFLALIGCAVVYLLLRILLFLRRPPAPSSSLARRLCYIKTDFWGELKAGGSVTHTREFVNAGCDSGYEISVFSCDPLTHYRLKPKVEVIQPASNLYDLPIVISQMDYNLRFPLAVWRSLRGKPLDGIYQRHSGNNFCGIVLSMALNVPFFLEHNSSASWIAKNWSARRSAIVAGLCENLNFIGAYRIAVVSDALKKDLLARGVPQAKIIVNPNGVDPDRFAPHVDASAVRSRLPADKLLVGFIGVFGQWHGVLTLMASVKHVVKEFASAHFVIIGDGGLKLKMMEILARDGAKEHVTFVGLVPHDAAPAYLNACDVLVSPHEDMADGSVFFGSPTKIFEYMATGKGIIASNVGQLSELLEHEKEALLVEQKNERQLADAIVRLLHDPALRERLGAAARSKVMSKYTWKENFRRAVLPRQVGQGTSGLAERRDEILLT